MIRPSQDPLISSCLRGLSRTVLFTGSRNSDVGVLGVFSPPTTEYSTRASRHRPCGAGSPKSYFVSCCFVPFKSPQICYGPAHFKVCPYKLPFLPVSRPPRQRTPISTSDCYSAHQTSLFFSLFCPLYSVICLELRQKLHVNMHFGTCMACLVL